MPCWSRSPNSIVDAAPRLLPLPSRRTPPTQSIPPAPSTLRKASCSAVWISSISLPAMITIRFCPQRPTSKTNLPTLPSLPTTLSSPAIVPGNRFAASFFTGRWVCYAEKKAHSLVPLLSTTKSAQQVAIPQCFDRRLWEACCESCFRRSQANPFKAKTFTSHPSCRATTENSFFFDLGPT